MKITTALCPIWLDANQTSITAVSFSAISETPQADQALLQKAALQLQEFFNGQRQTFTLPLAPGGTPFQQEVWQALQQIPYGQTVSYAAIAETIHRPKAVRAIGQANKANPLPIIIPCHRVIGKNGQLAGYMGAGKEGLIIKQALLRLEQAGC